MTKVALSGPFGDECVEEIILTDPPLARVICQVRFPRLSKLAIGDDAANTVASALADYYPVFNETREITIVITPEGVSQAPSGGRAWQLDSADGSWKVSFGAEFVAVHTERYTTREEFAAHVAAVLGVFCAHLTVPHSTRIGIRYINRVENATVDMLKELVRPELLGGLAVPMAGVELATAMNEAMYNLAPQTDTGIVGVTPLITDGLQARWGLLPAGAVLDPTLPPAAVPSWVLDLDSFRATTAPFTPEDVASSLRQLAERAYRYFRWVVTPEFLTRFGG